MKSEAMRRHKRVPLAASVVLTFEESIEELPAEAMTADISFNGIGLYVGRQLPEDTAVTIEISFIASVDQIKTETVRGRIVYLNHILRVYFVGIEFSEELSPEKQPELYNRIQNILRLS